MKRRWGKIRGAMKKVTAEAKSKPVVEDTSKKTLKPKFRPAVGACVALSVAARACVSY